MTKFSMKEKLDLLAELLPELTINDLKHIFNLNKIYSYNIERLEKLTSKDLQYVDEKAIFFTSLNLESLKWAIELICKEKFDRIYSICNM
jgi:hypothetical protein